MKQLFMKQTSLGKDVLPRMSIFTRVKLSFDHKKARKHLSLSACRCWDDIISLREMDQKIKFAGAIGYGDSYLEFSFRQFRVFRLDAILHDAAGAERSHTGKGPGYCYMNRRGPNSCLLGHAMTPLLPLNITLPVFHFQLCRLLRYYVLHSTGY